MAIYVPNTKGYFPKLQPFKPDYKFLTDILDVRTDRYETNYKQLNNLYGDILYADLTREDTIGMRDQFVKDLQPTIEKISGLDLSLAQNVSAAKAVFKPFYDDDLIVSDIVQTKNKNKILRLANELRSSPDEEQRNRWNPTGLDYAMIQFEKFVNAKPEEAVNVPLARYIENPQLYRRAKEYLDKKGYKIQLAPKYSENGAYKIVTTNGEDVTDLFYAEVKEMFGDDPLVRDAYFADAYVQAHKYAENGMQGDNPQFSNITEGMVDWNKNIINSNLEKMSLEYSQLESEINTLTSVKAEYDKYLKDHAFVPGSMDDIKYKNIVNAINGKTKLLDQKHNAIAEAKELIGSNDPQMINNRGFNILFQSNIISDLQAAAQAYSMQTKSTEVTVDELYKMKYKSELDSKLELFKHKLTLQRDKIKYAHEEKMKYLDFELENQGLDQSFKQYSQLQIGDSSAVGYDKDVNLTT